MKVRVISGLAMLPLLFVVYLGGIWLFLGCLILSLCAVDEFYKGFGNMGIRPSRLIGRLGVVLMYLTGLPRLIGGVSGKSENFAGKFGLEVVNSETSIYMFFIFIVVLACLLYLFKIDERKPEDAMATLLGVFYVGFFSYHITLVEQAEPYGLMVWLVFFSAFGTDVMAYFTGYAIGKHKLCPKISPKKTIEGSVGGIIGSVVFCGALGYFIMPELMIHCLIIGALGGGISQFGDLTASIFKRKMGIKDYGNLIPGHGGVLDRIDSVLFTAPMVYYYIQFVLN